MIVKPILRASEKRCRLEVGKMDEQDFTVEILAFQLLSKI